MYMAGLGLCCVMQRHACTLLLQASTRFVTVDMRKRLMMVPIFDMAVGCLNWLGKLVTVGVVDGWFGMVGGHPTLSECSPTPNPHHTYPHTLPDNLSTSLEADP